MGTTEFALHSFIWLVMNIYDVPSYFVKTNIIAFAKVSKSLSMFPFFAVSFSSDDP